MPFWKRRQGEEPAPQSTEPDLDSLMSIAGAPTVHIGRKELYECGFQFCGANIEEAFRSSGLTVVLDSDRPPPEGVVIDDPSFTLGWLWINDTFVLEEFNTDVEVRFANGGTSFFQALEWDFIVTLRNAFGDPARSNCNWQLGAIDEGFLLILTEPDRLDEIAAHPAFPGYGVADLSGAVEIRRGGDVY